MGARGGLKMRRGIGEEVGGEGEVTDGEASDGPGEGLGDGFINGDGDTAGGEVLGDPVGDVAGACPGGGAQPELQEVL
jgi:hypothetical protein